MMNAEERITRTKIRIVNGNPFFAYLSLYLKIEEDKLKRIQNNAGMSVNPKGEVFYKKEFVDRITDDELLGVINHEISHLALLHLVRIGRRNNLKWNIATDLIINTMLLNNGYSLPKGIRASKNQFEVLGVVIDEIDKKTAEEIYEEMPEIPETKQQKIYVTFDNHETGKEGDEKELTEAEIQRLETEWFNRVQTALVLSQQRGQLPAGLERYIDKLKDVEINWRVFLWKFIQQFIPVDYSWAKRSKKGHALGIYLPDTIKEKIEIIIGIDTSGSIGQEELTKFLTEVINMARTFREIITMRILFHDVEIQGDYTISNGNVQKIMAMKIKGGGGTSHKFLFDKVKNETKNCQCLVSFTDGYSDIEEIELDDYYFSKLFVINKSGTIPKIPKGKATFIKLKDD